MITEIPQYEDDKAVQQSLLQRGGQLAAELLTDNLPIQSSETSEEQNLAMFKLKHTVKRENDDEIAQLKLFRASCRGTILPAARLFPLTQSGGAHHSVWPGCGYYIREGSPLGLRGLVAGN